MAQVRPGKARPAVRAVRAVPTASFDQYLHDIQKLPMITDVNEERRLARLAQRYGISW